MTSHNVSYETPIPYQRVGFAYLDYLHNHRIWIAELENEYLWRILWVTVSYDLTHSLRPFPYTKLWLRFVFEKQDQISCQSQLSKWNRGRKIALNVSKYHNICPILSRTDYNCIFTHHFVLDWSINWCPMRIVWQEDVRGRYAEENCLRIWI